MDQFLTFWSTHNISIIEALIASILFAVAFLTYFSLFGKKNSSDENTNSLDTIQIEKTLQKILDASLNKTTVASATGGGAVGIVSSAVGSASTEMATGAAEVLAEVAQLRKVVQEKQAQIEQLKAQAVAAPATEGAAAEARLSADERGGLDAKIRDLEARLSEYEIISEDIADLSRYKEENTELQKQLDTLKVGAFLSSEVLTTNPAAPESEPMSEVLPKMPIAAVQGEATVEAVGDTSADLANVVDDDLMKEFAAAVEGQKSDNVNSETDKLMNDFENFIKKG